MTSKNKGIDHECEWASLEFGGIKLGDKRLGERLVKLADRLASSPESPINQACGDWTETKAAYRFFQNENVNEKDILASHTKRTVERSKSYETILAIQDTSYFTYTGQKKTTGLGMISKGANKNAKPTDAVGLMMHTTFAVSPDGLPVGILDQNIFSRKQKIEVQKIKIRQRSGSVAIENKESIRWLNSLKETQSAVFGSKVQVVTVCDREGDFYEFFECAHKVQASMLIRACSDRNINMLQSQKTHHRLWSTIQALPCVGTIEVEIPARDQNPARTALLETRFGLFTMNPPRSHIRHKTEDLPDFNLNAVYVMEKNPPEGEEALEWMLLTNLLITSFEEAKEKVSWYCLRWRIEVFHKILKSGLRVEQCRLQTADRLIRYLTVMSIIAWRIYWVTLIARADPDLPCTLLFADDEWKVLYSKIKKTKSYPKVPPRIRETVRWIAQLGGFLARKGDGEPGVMTLWRGWKRLCDLSEGWNLALAD